MTITAIEAQKKDPNRVSLSIDGQFAFGLVIDLVWEHKLKVGQTIDQPTINQLRQADNQLRAYAKALNYLSVRPRSTQEIKQYLSQKLIYKHPDYAGLSTADKSIFIEQQRASIETIITKLQQSGYLDDVAFAKWWIDNRRTFKPRGRRLLLAELKSKGISDADIQSALTTPDMTGHYQDQHQSQSDELAGAIALARKYLKKQSSTDPRQLQAKLSRHLASKGYDWEIINQAWKSLVEDNQADTNS